MVDEIVKKTGVQHKFDFEMTIDGVSFILAGENIISFGVVHDFINNKVPIYLVKIYLNMEQYIELIDSVKPFQPVIEKIDFRVMKYEYNDKPEQDREYTTFRSYNNMSAVLDRIDDLDKTDLDNIENTDKNSDAKGITINLRIYDPKDISATSKGYSNNVIPSGTVAQGLYDIIDSTVIDDVSIFPVSTDNSNSFTNMVLPPLGFDDAISYLQKEYGLYKYDPVSYCRDKVLFIFPVAGNIDDTGNGDYSKKMYVEVRNSLDMKSGDYIEYEDDEKIHILVPKTALTRNKIYNVKHSLYAYVGDESIRLPKPQEGKLYDTYKVSSKNTPYGDVLEDIKQRMIIVPCSILPPEMDIYPTTMVKMIYDKVEGDYRVSKFTEAFTKESYEKRMEIYSIDQ